MCPRAGRPPPAITVPNAAATPPSLLPHPDRPADNADNACPRPSRDTGPVTMPSCQFMRAPSTSTPIRRKETGDAKSLSRPPAPLSALGLGNLRSPDAAKNLQRHVQDVSGVSCWPAQTLPTPTPTPLPGNAPRDPGRDVTPGGTPDCKNACTNVHGEWRKVRNSPADRRAASKNLHPWTLRAGPRAANRRQLTRLAARARRCR